MERFLAFCALALGALLLPGGLAAQEQTTTRTILTERWVEEWDPAAQRWVRLPDAPGEGFEQSEAETYLETTPISANVGAASSNARYARPYESAQTAALPTQFSAQSGAQYGPFRVLDDRRAAIVGPTDQMSPLLFDAMLRDNPGLEVIEMLEAPGTNHDIANLAVGRKIRAAGLRTHVPAGGSVRSGAVELFLAGATRTMDDGAEFAVHSWLDTYGREPGDFPTDHPANRLYLDYYVEMGMSRAQARDFYAMTNSVPHTSALWLGAEQMRPWIDARRDRVPARRALAAQSVRPVAAVLDQDPLNVAALALPSQIVVEPVPAPINDPVIAYADIAGVSVSRTDIALLDS